jgi:hypothetical protein
MKKLLVLFLGVFLVLAGCSSGEEKKTEETAEIPEIINVSIETPDKIKVNEEVEIQAHVMQGDEKVDDANEVKFEIWKSGQDDHVMLQGEHKSDGVYTVNKTFTESGTYFIISHVTARDMHSMPKKEIVVGNPNETTTGETQEESNEDAHHHEHSTVTIHLNKNESLTLDESTTLSATVQNEGQPLTDATVRFEIWKENEEKHVYIDAEHESGGEYKANYTFSSKGTYIINVHVTKGEEIHEHKEEKIFIN